MVFNHTTALWYHLQIGNFSWYVSAIGNSLVQWAVPVFVMISGALFLNPQKTITKDDVLRKYVKRLLIAYIFWWLFYSLMSVTIASLSARSIDFDISYFVPYYHLWYLPMLMGVYILIPVLKKIVTDLDLVRYALLLWIVYITLGFICTIGIDIPQISILFTLNRIIGFAGYFLLGYYVANNSIDKRYKYAVYSMGILGAIIMMTANIVGPILKGESDERFVNDLSPHVIMMALCVFVLIKENVHKSIVLNKVVRYVNKDLFGIYLIHAMWLFIFNMILSHFFGHHVLLIPIIATAVFVASMFTCKIMRKIPYMNRVVE